MYKFKIGNILTKVDVLKLGSVDRLLKKLRDIGNTDRREGIGQRQNKRTYELDNINAVNCLGISPQYTAKMHRTIVKADEHSTMKTCSNSIWLVFS